MASTAAAPGTPGLPGALDGPRLAELAAEYGTPLWVVRRGTIRAQIAKLRAFDVMQVRPEGVLQRAHPAADARGGRPGRRRLRGRAERALLAGYEVGGADEPIVFTADVLSRGALARVVELGVPVNAGSPQMLEQVGRARAGPPRVDPGEPGLRPRAQPQDQHRRRAQQARDLARAPGGEPRPGRPPRPGPDRPAHAHRLRGGLRPPGDRLRDHGQAGPHGLGPDDVAPSPPAAACPIPYGPGRPEVDTARYFRLWDAARRELAAELGHPVRLEIEPGRFLVANSGVLHRRGPRGQKPVGSNYFVLSDAGFNDLMRPAMYGSNHRVSVLGADGGLRGDRPARTPAASWPARCASRATSSPRREGGDVQPARAAPARGSATSWSSTTPVPTARACPRTTTPARTSRRFCSTATAPG